MIKKIKDNIINGGSITYEEACALANIGYDKIFELISCSNEIRQHFMGDKVDLCSILNVKSGLCSEDCRYCAQSIYYSTNINQYSLLREDSILKKALEIQSTGVKRISLVTSGRTLSDKDFKSILKIYRRLKKELKIDLCASHGLLNYEQAVLLKEAGVSTYHHNLETSEDFFQSICTTHTYYDRVNTIKAVQKAGLKVCCGGILSLGESMEQRIKLGFAIKGLNIYSIPLNVLSPIKGTPLENQVMENPMEIIKTIAIFRFILPNAYIRYAGGRQKGLRSLLPLGYAAGINSCLVGNYLTTSGKDVDEDIQVIKDMGLNI